MHNSSRGRVSKAGDPRSSPRDRSYQARVIASFRNRKWLQYADSMNSMIVSNQGSGSALCRRALLAALAGVIVFTLLLDPSIINPLNDGWLANGDPAASYLGWLFFRHEPWSLPLGLLHTLGMEQGSSIVYSDSIPLLAIFFKLLRAWLPAPFQYDGLWLCACYALQGYFACRLLMLFTERRSALIFGVLLFLFSPIMLLRAQGHLALSAHWIIVAVLYLYYAPPERRRTLHWLLLLWLTPMIHAYLMFMAYAIWGAYLVRYGVLDRRWSVTQLVVRLAMSVAGSLAAMWLAGYFLKMEVSTGGFGYYSMNMLAPFWPVGVGPTMPRSIVAATSGQYEGFNYLGLGILLALLFVALRSLAGLRRHRQHGATHFHKAPDLPLIAVAAALSLLAISNEVTWGSHVLFVVPIPGRVQPAFNIFRASGRMFWPVYYLLILVAIRGLLRLSKPICTRLLVVVFLVQMADLFSFFHTINVASTVNAQRYHFPVYSSPFWALARTRYANLYVVPGQYTADDNIAYESLANAYGFSIDTVYAARLPSASLQEQRTRRHEQFFEGALDPRGLYLIQPSAYATLASVQQLFPPSTGVGDIDGFTVVAPQWLALNRGNYLHGPQIHDFPPAIVGQTYRFGKNGDGQAFLFGGWSTPGDGATWSEGASAELAMHVVAGVEDLKIVLDAEPYLPQTFPQLGVYVRIHGNLLAHWQFERGKPVPSTTLLVPRSLRKTDDNLVLSFSFDQARSPLESGESVDPRKLALLLHSVLIQPK